MLSKQLDKVTENCIREEEINGKLKELHQEQATLDNECIKIANNFK